VINGIDQAYFEVQAQNPMFNLVDFNFFENTYNLIIYRGTSVVFKGEIDEVMPADRGRDASGATTVMDRIGFRASHRINRFKNIIATPDSGDAFYKRSFNNVSLGTAVQTLVQEAIARSNSLLSDVTIGTIENPVDPAGAEIKFTSDQFLYGETILNWIDYARVIGDADYWMDENDKFHFVKKKGIRRPEIMFRLHFGEAGNNLSALDVRSTKLEMYNKIVVFGAGTGIERKMYTAEDASAQSKYGLREIALPARELDTEAGAEAWGRNLLKQYSQPYRMIAFTPAGSHIPFEGFELGDEISVSVKWYMFNFLKWLRITGLETYVDQNNIESHNYILEEPKV